METALAIYRLHRAGVRYIYYIDVGSAVGDEAKNIVDLWKRSLKTKNFLEVQRSVELGETTNDDSFGDMLSKYNPMSLLEDIFWPVSSSTQSSSKVDTLSVDAQVRGIDDVEHFKQKLRSALNIPRAFFEGDISGWNANRALAQQDIRFAKKIDRIQRGMTSGLELLGKIHLMMAGWELEAIEKLGLRVHLTRASNLLELQRIEVEVQRWSEANTMLSMAKPFSLDVWEWGNFILKNVCKLSPADIKKYRKQKDVEASKEAIPAAPAPVQAGEFGTAREEGDDETTSVASGDAGVEKGDDKKKKGSKSGEAVLHRLSQRISKVLQETRSWALQETLNMGLTEEDVAPIEGIIFNRGVRVLDPSVTTASLNEKGEILEISEAEVAEGNGEIDEAARQAETIRRKQGLAY
jgi:hypothetical protein